MIFLKKSRRFFQKKSNDFSIVFIGCKNINVCVVRILMAFISLFYFTMFELDLLSWENLCSRVVSIDGITAEFVECWENSYDVSLDVNSQKFFIRYSDDWWLISAFEVISFKWFMINLTNSLIVVLRNLVDFLRSKL